MRELWWVIVEAHKAGTWRELAKDALGAIAVAATIWALCQIPK